MTSDKLWITWETQRRSVTLANFLGCNLLIFDTEGFFRYPICLLKTLLALLIHRPKILFVQNPSIVLAAFSCFFCSLSGTKLIVDRHSNFRLNKPQSGTLPIWIFMRLHFYSLKYADLTIVTNSYIAELVKKANGKPVVLPDKLPILSTQSTLTPKTGLQILLISSFGFDEPIRETIEAFRLLNNINCSLFITGNFKKRPSEIPVLLPPNTYLTGFIPDSQYIDLLFSSDIILVFTKADYCMLCGCYEAVSAQKPLITSDKAVLKSYFTGAVFVNNTAESICNGINEVINNLDHYRNISSLMKQEIEIKWEEHFKNLKSILQKSFNLQLYPNISIPSFKAETVDFPSK